MRATEGAGRGDNEAGPVLVSGRVIITAGTPAFSRATVHIWLEDVSYADAEAVLVAQTIIPNVRHGPPQAGAGSFGGGGDTTLPFALPAAPGPAAIDPRHDYTVRVWVDRDGDGHAGPNDLHSDQRYPVLTHGFGPTVNITLGPRQGADRQEER